MIYKYDPSKKKSYILRCFALNTTFYMLFVIFILLVEIFTKSSNKSFVITYGILLLLVSCITTFKRYTIYNKIEFEIGETFLEIRSPQKTTRIEFSEISGIKKRKYLFGLEECRIASSNYKAILITNNIENYDEILNRLKQIHDIREKELPIILIIKSLYWISLITFVISIAIQNLPLIIISSILLFCFSAFNIFRYAKSQISKSTKIIGIIFSSIFCIAIIGIVATNSLVLGSYKYRYDYLGNRYLMKLENKYKYDKNNNEIYNKNSYTTYVRKFDLDNNVIYYHDYSSKFKSWYEYENNHLVKLRNSYGEVYINEYDDNNKLIKSTNNSDYEIIYKYDENQNEIYNKKIDGNEISQTYYQYNEQNLLSNQKTITTENEKETIDELLYEYDEKGNLIHFAKLLDGESKYEFFYKYDDENRVIEQSNPGVFEKTFKYDRNNNIMYEKTAYQNEIIQEYNTYDDNSNLLTSLQIQYDLENDPEMANPNTLKDIEYVYNDYNDLVLSKEKNGFTTLYSYDYDKRGNILKQYSYYQKN